MIAKGFTEPTERIERLKRAFVAAVPKAESEHAVLVTKSYHETEGVPILIGHAKALERTLNHPPIVVRGDELVVGIIIENLRFAQAHPEFLFEWVEEEFGTMDKRSADPFKISEAVESELKEAFKHWRDKTINDLTSACMSEATEEAISNGVFTVGNYFYGGVGHMSANYGKVLELGFSGLIKLIVKAMEKLDQSDPDYTKRRTFCESMVICYNAPIQFVRRYAVKAREVTASYSCAIRETESLHIAQVYDRVPEHGATNFCETCQAFWFMQILIRIESSGHSVSPRRPDQYTYPYPKMDRNISEEFIRELLDCLWVEFNGLSRIRGEVSAQAFAGYDGSRNLIVGSQTGGGLNAINDVPYTCMVATAHMQLPQSSFSIRVHQDIPEEFLYRACEAVRLEISVPTMYNDETIIPTLCNRGVSLADARNYGMIGCVELQDPYKTDGWHDSAFVDVTRMLEPTLNSRKNNGHQMGPDTGDATPFKSTEDVWRAFKKQIQYFVYHVVGTCNSVDYAHTERTLPPFLSSLVDDYIGKRLSLQHGGAVYSSMGPQAFDVTNCGDSIHAMQTHAFEDKELTMAQLEDALGHSFGCGCCETTSDDEVRTYEAVRRILSSSSFIDVSALQSQLSASQIANVGDGEYARVKRTMENTTWYGNDTDGVDLLTRQCGRIYSCEAEKYKNPRGGVYQAGCYPVSANVLFGKDVGALPDGRLAKQPLADGVSPRQDKNTNGPAAATMSIAELDHENYSNGILYNQKLLPSAPADDGGLKHFSAVVRPYFDHRGMHIQFNVVGKNILLDAQAHSGLYKDLVVRVTGHSAQFTVLAREVQDDIISRTEQAL